MIYTELTKKAMKLCFKAHKDQPALSDFGSSLKNFCL